MHIDKQNDYDDADYLPSVSKVIIIRKNRIVFERSPRPQVSRDHLHKDQIEETFLIDFFVMYCLVILSASTTSLYV